MPFKDSGIPSKPNVVSQVNTPNPSSSSCLITNTPYEIRDEGLYCHCKSKDTCNAYGMDDVKMVCV